MEEGRVSGRRRSRSRSRDRHASYERNRSSERVDRRRSRSHSKSPEPEYDPAKERRRPTWFDIQPVGGAPPPISDLPGAVQVIPDDLPANIASSAQTGAANQQATRHARRIYVGGLPPDTKEESIATFFR